MRSRIAQIGVFGTVLLSCGAALAASKVQGRLTADGITGKPAAVPAGWSEEKIYLGQLNVGFGIGVSTINGQFGPAGWFTIDGAAGGGWPAGQYQLFTLNFDGPPAFSFTTVDLPGGAAIVDPANLSTPAHYSVMYNSNDPGYFAWGPEPWTWGTDFYQTFVATSSHVTRVVTKLAGKAGDHQELTLNFAIYKVNAGPPSGWQVISPQRSVWISGNTDPIIHLFWVPFLSKEVNLIVGEKYAARCWRDPGSPSSSFAIVARTDLNNGYADGQLYNGSTPRPDLDAFAYISGGQPGTIVNHGPTDYHFTQPLVGYGTRFGQTFVASGSGVAAANIEYATGDPLPPSLPVTFQLYTAVDGVPIGSAKRCFGAPGFYKGDAAAFWAVGEAPTAPGQTYYLEWTCPAGFNMWPMNDALPGQAYLDRVPQPTKDLGICIAEYAGAAPPPPVAEFTATPTHGHVPLNVAFSNQSTGQIFHQEWDFGDTSTSTVDNPGHTYAVPGTYTVALTATGPGGSHTETKIGYIIVTGNIGDFDDDGDVDQEDFGHLQVCYTGAGNAQTLPACLDAALDDDNDVDLNDFSIFQGCMSGANRPANPDCRP